MTRDEFLVHLRETPRDWGLTQYKTLRLPHSTSLFCPVTAVAVFLKGMHFFPNEAWKAGLAIGLSDEDTASLTFAGDGRTDEFELPALRKELLDACGVTERLRGAA